MITVRIIEIPQMKVAYSGPLVDEKTFNRFNNWFSKYFAELECELTPRDFMLYNEEKQQTEWLFAMPENAAAGGAEGFQIIDYRFGLYAVASCRDADLDNAADWMATKSEIEDFVNKSELFELDYAASGRPARYPLFRIASPPRLIPLGVCEQDMYIPIALKSER